jgi:hypothetical protein
MIDCLYLTECCRHRRDVQRILKPSSDPKCRNMAHAKHRRMARFQSSRSKHVSQGLFPDRDPSHRLNPRESFASASSQWISRPPICASRASASASAAPSKYTGASEGRESTFERREFQEACSCGPRLRHRGSRSRWTVGLHKWQSCRYFQLPR